MINVADVAIMTRYLTAWTNTHNALARKMKDQNGALKGAIQMETVEVVISLPKDLYKGIERRNGELETEYVCDELMKAIDNGTVLPKGHGRLIDADAFIEKLKDVRKEVWLIWLTTDELMQEIIETLETSGSAESDAPTVLEKEVGDDEV